LIPCCASSDGFKVGGGSGEGSAELIAGTHPIRENINRLAARIELNQGNIILLHSHA
jgi:hypothetical protein